jgi:hypothetical protein
MLRYLLDHQMLHPTEKYYPLCPEFAESTFYLYQATKGLKSSSIFIFSVYWYYYGKTGKSGGWIHTYRYQRHWSTLLSASVYLQLCLCQHSRHPSSIYTCNPIFYICVVMNCVSFSKNRNKCYLICLTIHAI